MYLIIFWYILLLVFCSESVSFKLNEFKGRVIAGKDAERDKYPFMVSLMIFKNVEHCHRQFACGGSIISKIFILTAAHCVEGYFF